MPAAISNKAIGDLEMNHGKTPLNERAAPRSERSSGTLTHSRPEELLTWHLARNKHAIKK
jgi:hypothetical protein